MSDPSILQLPHRNASNASPVVAEICESELPFDAVLGQDSIALAFISGVEGASYRPVGAAMAINDSGQCVGNLSAGCLDRDVAQHAKAAIATGESVRLRYGRGSPFLDIVLPCGGTLDITIVARPDQAILGAVRATLAAREPALLCISSSGVLIQMLSEDGLNLCIRPEIRFVVFGKGPEASCFSRLAQQAGYLVDLHSPDLETLENAGFGRELIGRGWPNIARPDPFTAVTVFFHDHDREPELLAAALESPAFYVGAQGSLRTHNVRSRALRDMGLSPASISRLASPFGLIPSVRDPRTLAVSVLADILQTARTNLHAMPT